MIDAQAVLAHLEKLEDLAPDEPSDGRLTGSDWLQEQLPQLSFQHRRDEAGNHWLTLPGASERSVVLGSYLQPDATADSLDSSLGLVTGLETLKALTLRFEGPPPCSVQLVVWAEQAQADRSLSEMGATAAQNTAAYLELHVEPGTQLQQAGAPLGVATTPAASEAFAVSPRLSALCDEAVLELTGRSASIPSGPAPHATAMARMGVATALLYVQRSGALTEGKSLGVTRLHLSQAAETFGRWAESTVHAVAGDQVDLWAREHRVPHTEQQ